MARQARRALRSTRRVEPMAGRADNAHTMSDGQRIAARLWAGFHVAWGSRAFWAYRALVQGPVFLVGITGITFAGFLAHLVGFIPAVLVLVLLAGVLVLIVYNSVLDVAVLLAADTEHALLLTELARKRETPTGYGQILWVRTRVLDAGAPPVWIGRRIHRAMTAIHGAVRDVGEVFPAFAQGRAPVWARWALAQCKRPMSDALTGRAFAGATTHAPYQAKEALLVYAAAWPGVFRLNLALWGMGQAFMLAVAALLALPLAWAMAGMPYSIIVSVVAVALWTGFAVKRVVLEPVLVAAAIVAFEEMVQGKSLTPETEALLFEVSAAFRELNERAREASGLEEGRFS